MRTRRPLLYRGFTLVEMVVVIVLTSIIASAVAMFIRLPVQGYVDTARRAEMTDIADTALRRMGRDLHLALPNSVRVTDGGATIEILLTKTGGRYRVADDGAGSGDLLDFTVNDTSFDQLGLFATGTGQAIVAGDRLVVYNLNIPGADAYAGDNTATISSPPTGAGALANENKINFAAKKFPFESPGNRFQVIEGPISYVCDTTTGRLTRYSGYGYFGTQRTAVQLAGLVPSPSLLATNVASCVFGYIPGITARSGLVALTLVITEAGEVNESVRLYHEVHVTNVP
ncbi:MAG: type II secretion system protein [Burkholderiales bacterium]|nr:type II secretion system protein [Burkholderiales bacterium]